MHRNAFSSKRYVPFSLPSIGVPIGIAALSASITRTHNRACQWATASLGDVMCVARHVLTN